MIDGFMEQRNISLRFNFTPFTARVELLPGLEFTGKMVKIQQFTGKIGKVGKR